MALFILFIKDAWLNFYYIVFYVFSSLFVSYFLWKDVIYLGSDEKKITDGIKLYESEIYFCEVLKKKEDYHFNTCFNHNNVLRGECEFEKDRNGFLIRDMDIISEEKEFLESKKDELTSKNESLENDIKYAREENLELIAKTNEWERRIKLIKKDISNLKNENKKLSEQVR